MASALRLAAVYGALLAVVALGVNVSRSVVDFDVTFGRWMAAYSGDFDRGIVLWQSRFLTPTSILVATLVIGGVVAVRRSRLEGMVIVGVVGFAGVMDFTLKAILPSERPLPNLLASVHGFPSGHVATVVALGGIVALTFRRSWVKVLGLFVAAVVATLTAQSRVLPGIHWVTDVIGGVLLGCLAVMLGLAVIRHIHNPQRRAQDLSKQAEYVE